MDNIIQKNINNYFCTLAGHVTKWNDIIEKLQRPLTGLRNQAEQLRHVERVNYTAELIEFPDLRDKLLFKIFLGIDSELVIFKSSIIALDTLNQDLRNKLVSLEKATVDFDWYNNNVESGSAFQPRLSDLLQMALESWKYYSEMYKLVSTAVKSLDVRNNLSIDKLQNSMHVRTDVQNRIDYILAITQYCNKNS